jgi:hypothetical protein
MGWDNDRSILARPPKLPPRFSLMAGLVCIPLGAVIQGMFGGVMLGAGVGLLAAAAWDFSRLRFVAWRRGKAERRIESREGPA